MASLSFFRCNFKNFSTKFIKFLLCYINKIILINFMTKFFFYIFGNSVYIQLLKTIENYINSFE